MEVHMATERSRFVFTVKEGSPSRSGADAPVWLMAEPDTPGLSVLKGGHLGMELAPGTKIDKAQEIAKFLNTNIRAITYNI
jgi:hypothetical protein